MKKIFLALLISVCSLNAFAAKTLPDVAATKAFTDGVVALIAKGNLESSYTLLGGYWALPEAEFKKMVSDSQQQRIPMAQRYGKVIGAEYLKSETVGQSFVRHIYLEKLDTHAVRWIFTFYKPNDVWILNAVLWDDQVYALFNQP
jgi:hypothetical protein